MPTDQRRGIYWALGAALSGGIFLIPWKLANSSGDPASSAFGLLAFAALFNTVLALASRRSQPRRPMTAYEWRVAALLGVVSLLGNFASASAITSLSASVLTILLRSEVLFVAVLAWVILRERVEGLFWVGALVAAVGVVVLHAPGGDAQIDVRGTAFAIAAVICFGTMAVVTRKAIHHVDPVRLNAVRLWISLPLWILLSGGLGSLGEMEADRLGWIALAAFTGPFVGRLCMILSSRHIEARVTSLVVLASPLVTIPLDLAFLGHVPAVNEIVGGAILLSGIAIPLLASGRGRAGRPPVRPAAPRSPRSASRTWSRRPS